MPLSEVGKTKPIRSQFAFFIAGDAISAMCWFEAATKAGRWDRCGSLDG